MKYKEFTCYGRSSCENGNIVSRQQGNTDNIVLLYIMVFDVLNGIGNSCVIYSILVSEVNRKNFKNSFLLALAIADVLFCLQYPTYILVSVIYPKVLPQDEIFCPVMQFLSFTLGSAGIMAITALSLDRYLALKYPFFHRHNQQPRVAFLVNLLVYIYLLAWSCPWLIKEECVECFEFPPAITISKAYSFSLSLLVFVIPGVILAFANVYVFLLARKRYSIRANDTKQTAKLNRVSDAQRHQALEVNRLPESSREKLNSESIQVILVGTLTGVPDDIRYKNTSSFQDKAHKQSVTGNVRLTREMSSDDSSDLSKLKAAGFENRVLFQKIGRRRRDADTTITADQQKSADIEEHISVGNRINEVKRNSKTAKQLKPQQMQKESKMAMMTVALVISFFITFLPFAVSRLVSVFAEKRLPPTIFLYIAAWTTFKSVINPYIVLAARDDIREIVLRRQQGP